MSLRIYLFIICKHLKHTSWAYGDVDALCLGFPTSSLAMQMPSSLHPNSKPAVQKSLEDPAQLNVPHFSSALACNHPTLHPQEEHHLDFLEFVFISGGASVTVHCQRSITLRLFKVYYGQDARVN